MAQWITVAEGASLSELSQIVPEMELSKGTKVKVVFDTWASWAFDVAGAELVIAPFMPDGLDLIDVYGENGQGIVDMEADPAWLVATLAFIRVHWLAITIAGLALALIVSFITVMVKVPPAAAIPLTLIVGVAIGIVGLMALSAYTRRGAT